MNSVSPSRSSGGADLAVEGEGSAELEIDVAGLRRAAVEVRSVRSNVLEYVLANGKGILLLAGGAAAGRPELRGGPPGAVMGLTFAPRALAAGYLVAEGSTLRPGVHPCLAPSATASLGTSSMPSAWSSER